MRMGKRREFELGRTALYKHSELDINLGNGALILT
jgi:hypothetical protein